MLAAALVIVLAGVRSREPSRDEELELELELELARRGGGGERERDREWRRFPSKSRRGDRLRDRGICENTRVMNTETCAQRAKNSVCPKKKIETQKFLIV